MGISYIIDDLIDNGHYDGMYTGWNPINNNALRAYFDRKRDRERDELRERSEAYKKAVRSKNSAVAKRTREQIETEYSELENSQHYYRLCEKNLLRVKNKCDFQTAVVSDIVDGLLEFYSDSCDAIFEFQEELKQSTKLDLYARPRDYDEKAIKKEIADGIFSIIDSGIRNDLPLSRELFRKMVRDLEKVLERLIFDGEKVKKLQVEQYFADVCNEKVGMVVCQNCGRPLLKAIPYCFNCYEGRYS